MLLQSGGIDVYYIDESHDNKTYVVTAVCVPFLRNQAGHWMIVWPTMLEGMKAWRRHLKQTMQIPTSRELHGVDLASGRGNYNQGKYNFSKAKASGVYRAILRGLNCVPDESIMSACAQKGKYLYGNDRLEAAMYALFQRMRMRCRAHKTNAITFFDQGHPEYRKLYRMAQVHLPTGSAIGMGSRNLPLDMFTKDANEKNSKHCFFTQAADIVAYAAFLKIKGESGRLSEWQKTYHLDTLYDEIPKKAINVKVSSASPRDGIVRLK